MGSFSIISFSFLTGGHFDCVCVCVCVCVFENGIYRSIGGGIGLSDT